MKNKNTNAQKSLNIWNKYSLIAIAAMATLSGLLLPANGICCDVLIIFSICLTVAVVLIALVAKNNTEAAGFAQMVLATTMVQIAVCSAYAKLVIMKVDTGIVINSLYSFMPTSSYIQTITVGLAAIVSLCAIAKMKKNSNTLKSACKELIEFISPIREMGIKGMIESNYITEKHAAKLTTAVENEKAFHISTSKSALFVLYGTILQTAIIAMLITGSALNSNISAASVPLLLIVTVTAYITILSCGRLARKNVPIEIQTDSTVSCQENGTVEVVCRDINEDQNHRENIIPVEPFKEQIFETRFAPEHVLWTWGVNSCRQTVGEISSAVKNGNKIFLMASDNIKNLPVTAALNTAMELSKTGLKCLLVDFDFVHTSISKVFAKPASSNCSIVEKTGITNLHILSAANSNVNNVSVFKSVMNNVSSQYDVVLIYAPAVKGNATKQQIASCIDMALLFAGNEKLGDGSISKFYEMLTNKRADFIKASNQDTSTSLMTL